MSAFYTHTVPAAGSSSSELVSTVRGALARLVAAVWRALDASGRARARRDLLDLAARYEGHQPGFAEELRIAAQRVTQA